MDYVYQYSIIDVFLSSHSKVAASDKSTHHVPHISIESLNREKELTYAVCFCFRKVERILQHGVEHVC